MNDSEWQEPSTRCACGDAVTAAYFTDVAAAISTQVPIEEWTIEEGGSPWEVVIVIAPAALAGGPMGVFAELVLSYRCECWSKDQAGWVYVPYAVAGADEGAYAEPLAGGRAADPASIAQAVVDLVGAP